MTLAGKYTVRQVRAIFSSGLDPRTLALTLAVGVALGVLPLLWGTTFLCALAARMLKLNQVAMQTVNYLCYPLQLALLLPFCRLGLRLFPWGPAIPPEFLSHLFHGDARGGASQLVVVTLKALGAWFIVAPLAAVAGYRLLMLHGHKLFNGQKC